MKKIVALICAAVMTVSCAVTAFAQPSVQKNGVVEAQKAVNADGEEIDYNVSMFSMDFKDALEELKSADKLKEVLGASYKEGMRVLDGKNIKLPDGTKYPVSITFNIPGLKDDTTVVVLYFNGTEWKTVEAKVVNGQLVVTITEEMGADVNLAFIVDKAAAETASGVAPKTGESNFLMWTMIVAVAAVAGMAVTYKKKNA